ncbi:hypothetical protein P5609_015825 [Bacillus licheniformis]
MHSQFETRAEHLTKHARFFEYTTASDPIGSGIISPVPVKEFGPELYETGETRIIPLDISEELKTDYPASSPSLLAHFIKIRSGDTIHTAPRATSELYYIVSGAGKTETGEDTIHWQKGDFLTLPAGSGSRHTAGRRCSHLLHHRFTSPELFGRKAVGIPLSTNSLHR